MFEPSFAFSKQGLWSGRHGVTLVIRRWYFRDKLSIRDIFRNTIRITKVTPLVPVITSCARTVDVVAREAAAQHLVWGMEAVRSVGAGVCVDRERFDALVARTIQQTVGDVSALAKAVAERPQVFGECEARRDCWGISGSARRLAIWLERLGLMWATRQVTGSGGMNRRSTPSSGGGRSWMSSRFPG